MERLAGWLPPASFAGRVARWPLGFIPANAVLWVLAGPLRGARWIAHAGTFRAWLGFYEPAKATAFRRSLGPGAVVVDVGAHVGYYTLLAARSVGHSGTVIAFEPNERNVAILRRHVALNALNNVEVVEAAVGAAAGRSHFDPQTDGHLGRLSDLGPVEVEVVCLDDIFAERGHLPNVIKIDVEGGEEEVLRGATAMLAKGQPTIFLATHGPDVHAKCCEILRSLGYVLRGLDSRFVAEATEIVAIKVAGQ